MSGQTLELQQAQPAVELQSIHGDREGDENVQVGVPSEGATVTSTQLDMTGIVRLKVISAAFCFFNAGVNDGSLGALTPYILRHYGISTSWMAIPYGISFVGWLLAAISIGYLNLLVDAGGVLLTGALLQLLAQVLRFWTPPFGLLAFSFLPVCLGQGLQDSQANTFVSTIKNAHRWLAVIHGSYAVGGLCGPLLASAVASAHGDWAAFYYIPTGIGAINIALCSFAFSENINWRKTSEGNAEQRRRSTAALIELKAAAKEKAVWLLSIFFFLYIAVAITTGGWVVEFLVTVRGGKLSKVGYISSAYFGGTALGRFLLAEPTFRLGEKRMLLAYAIVCLVLQIVFWQVRSIVADAVTVSILGFFLGPFFATGISVGSKLIPKALQSSGLALIFVMAQAGGAAFPAIAGVVAGSAGVGTLQPLLVGLLGAMTVSWAVVPNPKKQNVL